MMKVDSKKLGWNILGTVFLLFLLFCFSWNYYALQKRTENINQIVFSVVHGQRNVFSVVRGAPNKVKEMIRDAF
jgi:hypothetical protein